MIVTATRPNGKLVLEFDENKPMDFKLLMRDLERATIEQCLIHDGGVKARVAESLGLNRTTLVEKARRYGFPLKKND